MDIWDGLSTTRSPNDYRAPDNVDYAETIWQIQETQRNLSLIDPNQIDQNTTDIAALTITVGINTFDIAINAVNIANLTTDFNSLKDKTIISLTNNEISLVRKCTPVYAIGSGFKKAASDNVISTKIIGILIEDTLAGASGIIQSNGIVTATVGEWNLVIEGGGSLVENTMYYLKVGEISSTPPSSGYIAPIGIALNTTQLKINVLNTVLL